MSKGNKNVSTGGEAVYGLGMIGAAVYYLQQSTTLLEGLLGLVKAILWPAFLIHRLLGFLGM